MGKKIIALTFDDGPSNVTEEFLDVLEKYNVKGSFFLIGNNITKDREATVKREVALGMEICNHSLTHSDMTKLSADEIKQEIAKTTAKIKELAGYEPKFFRPPYISVNDTMHESIDLPFICGYGCEDWVPEKTAEGRAADVIRDAKNGNIVLLHDLESNYNTLNALPTIIEELRKQDFEFVTISDLFKLGGVNPVNRGKIWSNIYE